MSRVPALDTAIGGAEPTNATLLATVTQAAFVSARLRVAGWDVPWFAVVPR